MIRAAIVPDDVEALCAMGALFHAECPWAERCGSFDPVSFAATCHGLAAHGVLLVAEADGAPVGMIGASLSPIYFNARRTAAQEVFWYALPDHRAGCGKELLAAMESAVAERGADIAIVSCVEGMRGRVVGRSLRMAGYVEAEHMRWKELATCQ